MKKIILTFAITVFWTINVFGQTVKKCNIDILGRISTNEYDLTEKDIKNFLSTFDKSCSVNIEYSEFSNTLLFEVLDRYTQRFVSVMEIEKKNLQIDYILDEIATPINDGIDLKNLIKKVDQIKTKGKVKGQIVKRLQEAQGKY